MTFWPFIRSSAKADAANLLNVVIAASRQPSLYGEGRAPDTLEGRFELMTLHGALALIRLRAEPGTRRLAQIFADRLFRHFDSGLREAGVGDLSVPKRMRRLAGAFYGRLAAYSNALESQDHTALEQAVRRNLLNDNAAADAAGLAVYALDLSGRLAKASVEDVVVPATWGLLSD